MHPCKVRHLGGENSLLSSQVSHHGRFPNPAGRIHTQFECTLRETVLSAKTRSFTGMDRTGEPTTHVRPLADNLSPSGCTHTRGSV
jgi:hypothetical protein